MLCTQAELDLRALPLLPPNMRDHRDCLPVLQAAGRIPVPGALPGFSCRHAPLPLSHRLDRPNLLQMSDFNIECDSTYKALMYPVAFVALCVYAAGVPLTFLWRLHMHREVLQAPGPRWCLGFLYRDYEERFYFFECVQLVRKV